MNHINSVHPVARIIAGMLNCHLADSIVLVHSHRCNSQAAHHHRCTVYSLMAANTVYVTHRSLLLSLTSHLQPNKRNRNGN